MAAQEGRTPLQLAESYVLVKVATVVPGALREHAEVLRTLRLAMGIAPGSSSSAAANAAAPAPDPAGPTTADAVNPFLGAAFTPDQIRALAQHLQSVMPMVLSEGSGGGPLPPGFQF